MLAAAFITLRPIILVELIGLENLTSSFGIIVLCQGMSSLFGAPLAGKWKFGKLVFLSKHFSEKLHPISSSNNDCNGCF